MENASKALLFAAGILIAIILISVAVYIVGMANNTITGVASTMTEMELSSFNSKFTSYAGTAIAGSQIKQLVEAVNSSNTEHAGTDLQIEMVGDPTDLIKSETQNEVQHFSFSGGTARKYGVTIEKTDGAVSKITITGETKK